MLAQSGVMLPLAISQKVVGLMMRKIALRVNACQVEVGKECRCVCARARVLDALVSGARSEGQIGRQYSANPCSPLQSHSGQQNAIMCTHTHTHIIYTTAYMDDIWTYRNVDFEKYFTNLDQINVTQINPIKKEFL